MVNITLAVTMFQGEFLRKVTIKLGVSFHVRWLDNSCGNSEKMRECKKSRCTTPLGFEPIWFGHV